jgi:hypothetical protein
VTEDLALDLTGKAVEISWGDFSETLKIASFVQIRGRKYIYKKPREKVAAITKVVIDFDKCKLTLQMKNTPNLQKQGSVILNIIADSFNVSDTFTF